MIFWRFWQNTVSTILGFLFKIFKKSFKSYVSDTNGHRKRGFHEETIPIDTGETDFRSTVTHVMFLFAILITFCHKTINTVMPKLSYDNVTMLDNMTRQCHTVMSPSGPVDFECTGLCWFWIWAVFRKMVSNAPVYVDFRATATHFVTFLIFLKNAMGLGVSNGLWLFMQSLSLGGFSENAWWKQNSV